MVLLDLDVPAALFPSSTPGHSHLYIEPRELLTDSELGQLLELLARVGVIEEGIRQRLD